MKYGKLNLIFIYFLKNEYTFCISDDQGEFVLVKTNCFSPLCYVDVGEVVGLHTTLQ